MKKAIILSLTFSLYSFTGHACDICGCGAGSYYLGILPEFNQRFAGFRYQYNTLQTHLGPQGERTVLTNDETYQSLELWGAWNLGKKWRTMIIVPYNFSQRHIPALNEKGKKHGLGDMVFMGHYKVFDKMFVTSYNKMFAHSLWAGGGIKAPSGSYDQGEQATAAQASPNNFQLGTASTDFMLNVTYDARLMDLGLNTNLTYKINTENPYEYRYGNKFTANLLMYYKFNIKNKLRIAPNLGTMYEGQQKDELYQRFYVAQSGGNIFTAISGVEINMGRISLGFNYQHPFAQNMAGGRVIAGNRLMSHISFGF